MSVSMSLTWTDRSNYYISWRNTAGLPPADPDSGAPVPSTPLSPLPTLPAAQAESDA